MYSEILVPDLPNEKNHTLYIYGNYTNICRYICTYEYIGKNSGLFPVLDGSSVWVSCNEAEYLTRDRRPWLGWWGFQQYFFYFIFVFQIL